MLPKSIFQLWEQLECVFAQDLAPDLAGVIDEIVPGLFKVSAGSASRKKFGVIFDEPEEQER